MGMRSCSLSTCGYAEVTLGRTSEGHTAFTRKGAVITAPRVTHCKQRSGSSRSAAECCRPTPRSAGPIVGHGAPQPRPQRSTAPATALHSPGHSSPQPGHSAPQPGHSAPQPRPRRSTAAATALHSPGHSAPQPRPRRSTAPATAKAS